MSTRSSARRSRSRIRTPGASRTSSSSNNLSRFGNDANGPFTIDDKVYQVRGQLLLGRRQALAPLRRRVPLQPVSADRQRICARPIHFNGQLHRQRQHADRRLLRRGLPAGRTSARSTAPSRWPRAISGITSGACYIDDTCKVTPHLTVNWGLRWEVAQPLLDKRAASQLPAQAAAAVDAERAEPSMHPVYVRTGTGDFYEGIDFRFTGTRCSLARDGRLGEPTDQHRLQQLRAAARHRLEPVGQVVDPHGIRHLLLAGEQELDLRPESRHWAAAPIRAIDLQGVPTVDLHEFHQHQPAAGVVRRRADLGRRSQPARRRTRCSTCSTCSGRWAAIRRSKSATPATRAARWPT